MPFCESIKKQVRQKSAYQCCRCRSFGVEVHHIIPLEFNGDDSIENAAPLCPNCHTDFGDNPKKRVTIEEMRDWWYERVEEMYGPQIASTDKKLLTEIYEKVISLSSSQKEQLANHVSQTISHGSVIKGSQPSLYWYSISEGKRYIFPTIDTYRTWFPSERFQPKIYTISDSEIASIQIGGNITYHPGSRLLKIEKNPQIYAVSKGGILRLISSQEIAIQLFGNNWNSLIDIIPDYCFVNYMIGLKIDSLGDYDPAIEYAISYLP